MFENILVWQFIATLWDLNTLALAQAVGGAVCGEIKCFSDRSHSRPSLQGGIERADGIGGIQIAPSGIGRTKLGGGSKSKGRR